MIAWHSDRHWEEDTERQSTLSGRDKNDVRSHVEDGALALVRAAAAKDPSTVGYGQVVAKMAIVLARTLDPDGQTLHTQAVQLGALIHDIGKFPCRWHSLPRRARSTKTNGRPCTHIRRWGGNSWLPCSAKRP